MITTTTMILLITASYFHRVATSVFILLFRPALQWIWPNPFPGAHLPRHRGLLFDKWHYVRAGIWTLNRWITSQVVETLYDNTSMKVRIQLLASMSKIYLTLSVVHHAKEEHVFTRVNVIIRRKAYLYLALQLISNRFLNLIRFPGPAIDQMSVWTYLLGKDLVDKISS